MLGLDYIRSGYWGVWITNDPKPIEASRSPSKLLCWIRQEYPGKDIKVSSGAVICIHLEPDSPWKQKALEFLDNVFCKGK